METGSSSLPVSGACGSTDSLHGLAFGERIYYEDGCGGGGGGGGSSSNCKASVAAPAAKKGKGVAQQQQQQPPRCQVEGCKADLTGAKTYYCRHKVCGMHSKSPKVIVAGLEQRFCQQCSRFHQLTEFDQGKRSCRRRLAGHNERRRKPPPIPLSSPYGRLASSLHDNSRFRSFLMDFSYPRSPCTVSRNIWPTVRASEQVASNQWPGGFDVPPSGGAHSCMQGSTGTNLFNAEFALPVEGLAGVSDSSCALSLLSTQPWGTTTRNQAPAVSSSASFEGAPVAQPVVASDYMTNSCCFRCHGAVSSSHEIQHAAGLGQVAVPDGVQFSGELELALQGSRQCQDVCPGRACSHSVHVMHWSL